MSLKAENITKYYSRQRALDNVSFEISQGEVVALLGPNGAGKSTMMKIIACYMPQTSGKMQVCGFDTKLHPMEIKKRVGYLPEHNPLYQDMYVIEYLQFVAGIHRLGKTTTRRIDEMIELTGLAAEYKKTIGTLSKGYRQRVGLAQALIHDPEVLILDEPTSGLDPNQLTEIRALIKEIGCTKTIILSTHIMQEVEAVCNRVIIINNGKVMADAPTVELRLLNQADKVFVVEFDKQPDIDAIKNIKGVVEAVTHDAPGFFYRIFSKSDMDVRPDIFRYAVDQNLVLLSMIPQEGSLEQVFRNVTQ